MTREAKPGTPDNPIAVAVVPTIGEPVIYRTRAGIDIAAIITALLDPDGSAVHIEQFPPPAVAKDVISLQWGIEGPSHEPGCWRWREQQ